MIQEKKLNKFIGEAVNKIYESWQMNQLKEIKNAFVNTPSTVYIQNEANKNQTVISNFYNE